MLVEAGEGLFCGVVAAHSVDSGAGRCGRGAEINVAGGGGVVAPRGTEEKLAEVGGAAGNVAADEVGIHFFERGGGKDAAGENAIAKSGSEALDLRFEGLEHVDRRTIGDVAIGPGDVLPCRGAGGIEE